MLVASTSNIWGYPGPAGTQFFMFRIFQAKKKFNFFLTKSCSLFAISVGQLYTRAAVKELEFRAEAGAVGSLRAESELQLRLSF